MLTVDGETFTRHECSGASTLTSFGDNNCELPVRRPDILTNSGGVEYAIDVVVAELAPAHHIADRRLASATVPEGAAKQSEKRKVLD